MHLGQHPSYLALHQDSADASPRVKIEPNLSPVVAGWSPATRVSPIWGVREYGAGDPTAFDFAGRYHLHFLGPVAPARLPAEIHSVRPTTGLRIWLTAGSLNVVVQVRDDGEGKAVSRDLRQWSRAAHVAHEVWTIQDGLLKEARTVSLAQADTEGTREELARVESLLARSYGPGLTVPVQEYCTLIASALCRSEQISPYLHSQILQVSRFVRELVDDYSRAAQTDGQDWLDLQARLLSMNAALSRFAAQTLSGIPPIVNTECHFWIHSLLGAGSANLALARLAGYVHSILASAHLPERIDALRKNTEDVPDYEQLTADIEFLDNEVLWKKSFGGNDIAPLVTYFSGRDGFSSHLQTLSAPLTTIAECTSYRSNLLTATHEISHIFLQGVLAYLYPNADSEEDLKLAWRLTRPNAQTSNWLEAAQQLLLEGIIAMEQECQRLELPADLITTEFLSDALQNWRREVQEIMVHTFDFLYFYGSNTDAYISGIWQSWSAIPGIKDRVPEYLLRTLCAVSPRLLKEDPTKRAESARREVSEALQRLVDGGNLVSNYATIAISDLQTKWKTEAPKRSILRDYNGRLYLVRLVVAFLHSDRFAASLFRDPHSGSGSAQGQRLLRYDLNPIGNPLQFLRGQLKSSTSEAESLWALHTLAFNLDV